MGERITYLDLKDAKSLRTFDNETFILKGSIAIDQEDGHAEKLADVYYRVRTAVDENKQIIAKRKSELDELEKVKSNKRFIKS